MPVLVCGKEKERSKIRFVEMANLKDFPSIRTMEKVLNAWIREMCRVMKGVDERIDEGVS